MEDAHQSFAYRFLQYLRIILIRNLKDCFNRYQYNIHDSFEVTRTCLPTLQKQFPYTHQYVYLQLPCYYIFLYNEERYLEEVKDCGESAIDFIRDELLVCCWEVTDAGDGGPEDIVLGYLLKTVLDVLPEVVDDSSILREEECQGWYDVITVTLHRIDTSVKPYNKFVKLREHFQLQWSSSFPQSHQTDLGNSKEASMEGLPLFLLQSCNFREVDKDIVDIFVSDFATCWVGNKTDHSA